MCPLNPHPPLHCLQWCSHCHWISLTLSLMHIICAELQPCDELNGLWWVFCSHSQSSWTHNIYYWCLSHLLGTRCKDPLSATLGSATSEHPSATCLGFSLPPSPSTLVHCLLLKLRCKILQTNHTSSRLHSLPPLPFYISFSIHLPVHPVQQHPVYPLLTNTVCSLAPITIS